MKHTYGPEQVNRFLAEHGHFDIQYVKLAQPAPTSHSAASALSVALSNVVKSLVFFCDNHPVVVLIGGDRKVDEDKLTLVSESQYVRRANPTEARTVSGFAVGAIPPFGHVTEMRTFVDAHVMAEDILYASAGALSMMIAFMPPLLLQLPNVVVADVSTE